MIQPVSMRFYQQIAETTSKINSFISEALFVKSQLSRIPLMENGVGNNVNLMA